jgi:TRAP-type mannitol/chloroaromatic compound transport system substrate-binding protein
MHRRQLIGLGAAGLAAGALAACGQDGSSEGAIGPSAPAISKKRQKLTMVTTWPKDLPGLGTAATRVADKLKQLTDGRITVDVYAAGELVPALQAFDTVADGNADMYHGAEYYWQGKSKAFTFFTAVPFGMTAQEIMGWIDFGGGQALWEELSSQYGIISFQAANTGHQMGGWFKKEISSLDDFRGLKMRIPGLGGDLVNALGGASVTLAGGEIFQALQTGQIDATEWVGPWNDYYLGFFQEAPYYYGPGFHEPGASLAVGMNRKTWDGLSASDQALVRAVCSDVNNLSLGEFTHQNSLHLKKLVDEEGTQLRRFPADVEARAVEAAADIRASVGAQGGLEKRIYDSFEETLKTMRGWARVSEGAYYAAREAG